jgi:hypothetical protein
LVVRGHGRGSARLRYRKAADEDRDACLRRQDWALGVLASCGVRRSTLREDGCLARGDVACEYAITWADEARWIPPVLAGILTAVALLSTRLPATDPAAWLLVPLAIGTAYLFERWRVQRANLPARRQSAEAFRVLIGGAVAEPPPRESQSAEADDAHPEEPPAEPAAEALVTLEQEGDFWRVAYQGTTVLLRHSRGLTLLAHLVKNPGREIHVATLDAITPSGGSAVARWSAAPEAAVPHAPRDAGDVLDARARSEYRRRIVELREELGEAQNRHDLGRVEALRAELEMLEDEVRAALGPGKRGRRMARDTERLRQAITRRIRAAVGQIERHHPALGAHLAATVSTGYRCVYRPRGAAGDA